MMKRKMDNETNIMNDSGTPMDGVELDSSTSSSNSPAASGNIQPSIDNLQTNNDAIGTSSIQPQTGGSRATTATAHPHTSTKSLPNEAQYNDFCSSMKDHWKPTSIANVLLQTNGSSCTNGKMSLDLAIKAIEQSIDKAGASSEALAVKKHQNGSPDEAKMSGCYSPDQDTGSDFDEDTFHKTIDELINYKKFLGQFHQNPQLKSQQQQQSSQHQQHGQVPSNDRTSNHLNPLRGFGDLFDDDDLD